MTTLYLIPVPLAIDALPADVLPDETLIQLGRLDHFVAENAKTARAFLKAVGRETPIRQIEIAELNEHTSAETLPELLEPLRRGHDLGLISEAGCPAVADPGANLVALAHTGGFSVKPLVGPSSILLALMASGLSGQNFAFQGYLPIKSGERKASLRELEKESRRLNRTQIFIETPYRNDALLTTIIETCQENTRLFVACNLTLPGETLVHKTIGRWKNEPRPSFDKKPAVFLLMAGR